MKILRKNNDFKKMPDKNLSDAVTIKSYIESGWSYCSRREYKDFFNSEQEVVESVSKKTEKNKKESKNK